MDKGILKKWLKAGFVENGQLYPTTKGTPQGGVISPTIANMTLDGLQGKLAEEFPTGKGYKVNLCRYADDIVITGASKELLEDEVKPALEEFLAERRLKLSATKTKVVHISEGFDFLGKSFRKHGDKLLVTPSKAAVKRFKVKIGEVISNSQGVSAYEMLMKLNLIIVGWRNYHQYANSKEAFSKLDYWITGKLMRWVRRRHGDKNGAWQSQKYYDSIGKRNWVFHAVHPEKLTKVYLKYLSKVPIKTYPLIKGDANPYDPEYELYFESRHMLKASTIVNMQVKRLFEKQRGKCPKCKSDLQVTEQWHIHHIVYKVLGGSDMLSNLALLHENCHRQLHSQDPLMAGCNQDLVMPY